MFGLLISLALGAIMVVTAASAARSGELTMGEGTLRRGDRLFPLAVGAMGLLGAGLWSVALHTALTDDGTPPPPQTVEGAGFAAEIPAGWSRRPQVEAAFGDGAVVFGEGGAEVVLLTTRASLPADAPRRPVRAHLEALGQLSGDDALGGGRRTLELPRALAFEGQHLTPRGVASTRLIAFIEDDQLVTVQAMCTDDTDRGLCAPVVASLRLTAPEDRRQPLTRAVP